MQENMQKKIIFSFFNSSSIFWKNHKSYSDNHVLLQTFAVLSITTAMKINKVCRSDKILYKNIQLSQANVETMGQIKKNIQTYVWNLKVEVFWEGHSNLKLSST